MIMICPKCNSNLSCEKKYLWYDCKDCSIRFFYSNNFSYNIQKVKFYLLEIYSFDMNDCSIYSSGNIFIQEKIYLIDENMISDHISAYKILNKYIDNLAFV